MLSDGTTYEGTSFGFPQSTAGEVVFNTGMVGYPESLTDPSYQGQILALTYPLIGNYGMPAPEKLNDINIYYESEGGKITGLLVCDYSQEYRHWNAEISLAQWLYNQKIPAITGIDTRSLTRHLRAQGTMPGKIIIEHDPDFVDPNERNLVQEVSIKEPQLLGRGKKRVLVVDCGCKESILSGLINREVEVLRVPWNYPLRGENFDGLLISSGPGDPKMCPETVEEVTAVLEAGKPTFGICLGHQIMALAIGADTHKMKYGHRSQNQPVMNTENERAYITTQNHGFVVDGDKIPADWRNWFINLNDGSSEGLMHKSGKFFSVQFHPEAAPGPVDTTFLFDHFISLLK